MSGLHRRVGLRVDVEAIDLGAARPAGGGRFVI
jgi:hypothetical protein